MFFRPLYTCAHVTEIPLTHLKEQGVSLVILDLDNTLKKPHTTEVCPSIMEWLTLCDKVGLTCVCVSNNKNMAYCAESENQLGIPVVYKAHKPFGKATRLMLHQHNVRPNQAVLIGDRPLTDIWGAHHHGMHSILVDPLKKGEEPLHYVVLRWLERRVIGKPIFPHPYPTHLDLASNTTASE